MNLTAGQHKERAEELLEMAWTNFQVSVGKSQPAAQAQVDLAVMANLTAMAHVHALLAR